MYKIGDHNMGTKCKHNRHKAMIKSPIALFPQLTIITRYLPRKVLGSIGIDLVLLGWFKVNVSQVSLNWSYT